MLLAPVAVACRSFETERLADDAPVACILQLSTAKSPPLKLLAPLALTVRSVAEPSTSVTDAPLMSKFALPVLILPLKLLAPLSDMENEVPSTLILPLEA